MVYPPAHRLPPLSRRAGDVEHTQLRLRLLDGQAQDDHRRYIVRRVGKVRAAAWGEPQRTTCALRDLSSAVAVLYVEEPTIGHPSAADPADTRGRETVASIAELLRISGAWQVMAEAQRLTEALNECAVHVELDEDSRVIWRVVTPDVLDGLPTPGRPAEPALLREYRWRDLGDGVALYADEYDLRDPANPAYRVLDSDDADVTAAAAGQSPTGGWSGDAYPWRYSPSPSHPLGRPFIPHSLRHAEAAPRSLFSPWRRVETVDATLEACLIDTETSHVCAQNAFPFTWTNGNIVTEQIVDAQGQVMARAPILDPAAIHQVVTTEPGQSATVQVVRNETDPLMLMDVSERIVARCASAWGLGPSDVQRTAADARSGIALAVSNEGRRRMQAALAPIYRSADERLIGVLCALLNRAEVGGITDRPESGWQVSYTLSPLSPQERSQRQAEAEALFGRGAISRAEMRAMITGESVTQSSTALARIAAEQAPTESAPPNGAQIIALVDILAKIRTGEMTVAAAAALIPITFPTVSPETAQALAAAQAQGAPPPAPTGA